MFLITCFIFGVSGSLTWAGDENLGHDCPSGTFANKDGSQWYCYKLYERQVTFDQAEAECQLERRGHLASVTNDKQARRIGAYVTKENLEGDLVWIGYDREARTSVKTGWRWTDGTHSKYENWDRDEPHIGFYDDACVGLTPASGYEKWGDRYCHYKHSFLCKWEPSV